MGHLYPTQSVLPPLCHKGTDNVTVSRSAVPVVYLLRIVRPDFPEYRAAAETAQHRQSHRVGSAYYKVRSDPAPDPAGQSHPHSGRPSVHGIHSAWQRHHGYRQAQSDDSRSVAVVQQNGYTAHGRNSAGRRYQTHLRRQSGHPPAVLLSGLSASLKTANVPVTGF